MKTVLVTGGARSGKTAFALSAASQIKGSKAYIATAEALDEEMQRRIERHRTERGSTWSTYEEPINLPAVLNKVHDVHAVTIIDCLTVWLSNNLLRTKVIEYGGKSMDEIVEDLVECLYECREGNLFLISNEVGMGIVPDNQLAREFRDLAGSLNQKIAKIADEVYLVTAGIPLKLK